jgi:hypothetical protein
MADIATDRRLRTTSNSQSTLRLTLACPNSFGDCYKTYERQILLHTNSERETYSLNVHVQTAAIPVALRKPPYLPLALLGGISFGLVWFSFQVLPLWYLSFWAMSSFFLFTMFTPLPFIGFIAYVRVKIKKKGFSEVTNSALLILTIGLGSSLGVGFNLGTLSFSALVAVLGTGLPLAGIFLYPPVQRRRLIAKYRQSEQHLIKP